MAKVRLRPGCCCSCGRLERGYITFLERHCLALQPSPKDGGGTLLVTYLLTYLRTYFFSTYTTRRRRQMDAPLHSSHFLADRSPLRAGAHSEAGLHSTAEGHSTVALRNPKTVYSKWLQREPEEHEGGEVLEHHVVCASAAASRWARRQTLLRSSGS